MCVVGHHVDAAFWILISFRGYFSGAFHRQWPISNMMAYIKLASMFLNTDHKNVIEQLGVQHASDIISRVHILHSFFPNNLKKEYRQWSRGSWQDIHLQAFAALPMFHFWQKHKIFNKTSTNKLVSSVGWCSTLWDTSAKYCNVQMLVKDRFIQSCAQEWFCFRNDDTGMKNFIMDTNSQEKSVLGSVSCPLVGELPQPSL